MNRGNSYGGRRRRSGLGRLLGFCVIIGIIAGAWAAYTKLMPSKEYAKPEYGTENPIFYKGKYLNSGAVLAEKEMLLPLEAVTKVLGSKLPVWYEEQTQSIILTSNTKVLRMKEDELQAKLGNKPVQLTAAPKELNGRIYIPLASLSSLFGIQASVAEVSGNVTLIKAGDKLKKAEPAEREVYIRSEPSIRRPYVELAGTSGKFTVWEELDGWYRVQGPSGNSGYVRKDELRLTGDETIEPMKEEKPKLPWKAGRKVNMTWDAVYSKRLDPSQYSAMEGVNVVSPTWFELSDGSGQIHSKADANYAAWARGKGIQIWALFSNGFDPDRTTEALANVETRFSMIQQLLDYAKLYKLQGINIDFENVRTADKENLVQFVRELSPLLHDAGLIVSIDVTPKSNSELWSLFLDREALIQSVDYMMLMAYDEHWASSPKAGSVASLPWVEKSIVRLLEEDNVSASKLVLSMPLYTRIWSEKATEDQSIKVSSKSVGMNRVREIITNRKLKPVYDEATKQNYVEYVEAEGITNRIWIEDAVSIKSRVDLVHRYDLAGVATWARSFQTDSIWPVIHKQLNSAT
ncbi:glycosyl hydrolase family 18 protein [Paenibacillus herberti]|uniref:Glycosyl hydrolase n=1 Tax=Paenibacillus herberti TaxID=1619309 RepID=A0A229NV72_9BACL|nr:glycosyl hydrolase family 18 protein [Paenibacillus herberti]OXM13788.1 glycosyl hydrolase [Paenibacillus herberti]